ncbi:MAG: flagellar hook-basal body complex protein FliE [Candidatus Gastranaerophilales bacterium]|nr:flagellar hook-basal body complex protein FliE [Candidatus Gastranaerophilales bacterium]
MIKQNLVPNIDLFQRIEPSKYTDFGIEGMRMKSVEQPETENFKSVMSGLVSNLNQEMSKPDELLKDQMMGNSNVDIHDVTTAMAKAELGVTLATQVAGKVIQTYEKVMQISI